MGNLSVAKVRGIKKPGRYSDGGTLFLNVTPSGGKNWIQRITIEGRRRDLGLGGWPVVSLEKARRKAFENRVSVADGKNPLAEKHKEKTPTFREAAKRTHEALSPRWRNEKVRKNWWQILERHAFQRLGDMPVDKVGREDVLSVLSPLWAAKPEMARKLRRGIKATLASAQSHGYLEVNVAGEAIDGALPSMPSVKANFRAMAYSEVPEAVEIIRASRASMSAKSCLEFVILTACRSGEARHAAWNEVDFDSRTWRIPASRTKSGREHRQPLSNQALAVLEAVREIADGSDLIFPSPLHRGRELSPMTLTKVLRDCNLADRAVVHGFRSSFRMWASEETNADHAVMELSLAHQVGDATERAYARSDLYEKRRRLMEQWGRFVAGGEAGKVVELKRA